MKRRMNNLFRSNGKSFTLAIDHGYGLNVLPHMNQTGEVIKKALAGGVDSILTTFGIAQHYQQEIGNAGLMLRVDAGNSQIGIEQGNFKNIFSVEDAIRLGADGVMCMGFPGAEYEELTRDSIVQLASDCAKWNLVFAAEMLPRAYEPVEDARTIENIAFASRLGAELGADLIKTEFVGGKEGFKHVLDGCFKPVLVLGGGAKSDEEILQLVKDSMDAGASGMMMGRNIWKHPNVESICTAITKIVHEDAEVAEVLELV